MDDQEEKDQKSKEILLWNKHEEVFIVLNNNTRKKFTDVALKQFGKFFKSEECTINKNCNHNKNENPHKSLICAITPTTKEMTQGCWKSQMFQTSA